MLSRAYITDAQRKAEKLATAVVAASTTPSISAACSAIESFLLHHSPDHCRWFFSSTFPSFICKLFGFTDSSSYISTSAGWIDIVSSSGDSDISAVIFSLLSPDGALFSAISSVDALSLVNYIFPFERLPDWIRLILSNEKDCHFLPEICSLFRGKLSAEGVQLNIFEYYIFWFAYYPLCRGGVDAKNLAKSSRKIRRDSWSIPLVTSSTPSPNADLASDLYNRLLRSYLLAFVPFSNFEDYKSCRSALLHYPSECNVSVAVHAEFVVNTFIHFWLTYNDFSPFPGNFCKSLGLSVPFRMVLGEAPPPPGMAKVAGLFVKHVNAVTVSIGDTKLGSDGLKSKGIMGQSPSIRSWNSWIQRPLYRFILRSFIFCPVDDSLRNAPSVFDLWVSYLEPWAGDNDLLGELDSVGSGSVRVAERENQSGVLSGYSSSWKGYVVCNYLFYTSLTMHFIDFAHKFLHVDLKLVLRMVFKVVEVLTSSRELTEHLKNVDRDLHSKQVAVSSFTVEPDNFHRSLVRIREHFMDWEDGVLSDGEDERWFSSQCRTKEGFLRLFSDGEDGGQQLLQLLILRAESELHMSSGHRLAQNLQLLHALRSRTAVLFGGDVARARPEEPRSGGRASDAGVFRPRMVVSRSGEEVGSSRLRRGGTAENALDLLTAAAATTLSGVRTWLNGAPAARPRKVTYVDAPPPGDVALTAARGHMEAGLRAISSWGKAQVMASLSSGWLFVLLFVLAAIAMAVSRRAFGQG